MTGGAARSVAERVFRVLAVDDEEDIRKLIVTYMELEGFQCFEASDGREAVEVARRERPDLVLLDVMMPVMSGTEALTELRRDFRTAFTPIVFLTARALVSDKVDHLLSGADDYIVKPFDPDELVARVRVVLRRAQSLRGLNPITGLPGNTVISEEIGGRLAAGRPFACLYLDLDNFKCFNDYYGFARGDDVIRLLSRTMIDVLESLPSDEHFAGHIGGDDFVIVTAPDLAADVARRVIERFGAEIQDLYDPTDRARGWIEIEDRRGQLTRFALVSVSIGIVDSRLRSLHGPAEVAHVASELKAAAKKEDGSAFIVDHRAPC